MLMVGMGAWADTVTSTFTNNQWAVGAGEPEWVKTGANATSFESASPSRGVQTTLTNIKSSGLSLKNTTIKNLGKITGVSLVVSANGTGGSISSVTVGSTNFKCSGSESYTVKNETGQTPSFTNATGVSGDIVITFASTATSKSLYVKSITVTYESSDKTALGTPANLTSSNVTDRSATLSWDAVANADSYVVKIGSTEYNASSNSYNATGLDYNTEYTWSVKALAGDSEDYSDGAFSASSNFTTLDFTVQAGTYNVLPNDAFWGKSGQNGSKNITANTSFGPVTDYGVTFSMNSGKSTNSYFKDDQCRAYDGYTLTITAPTGYNLTAINFTGSTWAAPTASVGTMNSKSWTGCANEVTFTFSGTSYMTNIKFTYIPETADVTIGSTGYATFVAPFNMNFDGTAVTAYLVEPDVNNSVVHMTEVTEVPAGTALVVKGTTASVPTTGFVESVSTALEVAETATENDGVSTFYYLGVDNGTVGFRPLDEGGSIAAGKCFFRTTPSAKFLTLSFDDEVSGITSVENTVNNGAAFNLAGQRVDANAKGIVIINGKKYINK